MFGNEILFKMRIPIKRDYYIFKPKEQRQLTFEFDITKLKFTEFEQNDENKISILKGYITFQLFYFDHFQNHPLAIDSLASNKIIYNYHE